MTRLRSVMHIIDSLDVSGGAERQLLANLQHFRDPGLRHSVVAIKKAANGREADVRGHAELTTLFEHDESPMRLQVIKRIRSLVRAERPSLLHASLPDASFAARVVGRLEHVPVIESLVNISHEKIRTVDHPHVTRGKLAFHRALDRITMRYPCRFHAVSDEVARSWSQTVGIPMAKMRVIPRAVEVSHFATSDPEKSNFEKSVRFEFGLASAQPIVITIGRVEPQKGHVYLVRAMRLVLERFPEATLIIIGRPGSASESVETAVKELELGSHVIFAGARRDVKRLLAAADIFAFPSLFEGNGGNALIEAMAAGLAVVTTSRPPMTDLVPDESVGLLAERSDVTAIAQAICRLAADEGLRLALGNSARHRAESFPGPEEIAKRYEEWYREILAT